MKSQMKLLLVLFTSLVANASLITSSMADTASQGTTSKKSSGYFFAYNDTDKTVVLSVGNYFPTTYTIDPRSYRMVWVSTDNQNIHIKDAFP